MENLLTIVKGSEAVIPFTLRYKSKDPFPLTGKNVSIKYRDGNQNQIEILTVGVTIISDVYGKASFKLSSAQTLALGDCGTFDFDIYIVPQSDPTGDPMIVPVRNKVVIMDTV